MLKNISYTLLSNLISFAISAVVTFLVPKRLGVESYGYFQLYLFYLSYIGVAHLGWSDGVFLRYGGYYYDKLDKPKMSAQFWMQSVIDIVIGIGLGAVGSRLVSSEEKKLVITAIGVAIGLFLPRLLLQYILQATNRIKEYSQYGLTN